MPASNTKMPTAVCRMTWFLKLESSIRPLGSMSERTNISGVYLGTQVIDFENNSLFLNDAVALNKKYMYPSANGWFNYRLTKSKSLYAYYNFEVNMPTPTQLLPVVDLSNPLSQIVGTELNPGKSIIFT